jgi:two-component system response regulator HydG
MPRKTCLNAPMKEPIFLDEIVNTSEAVQMEVLCIIQEKKVKHLGGKNDIAVGVQIITASNINLNEAVKAGKLRTDLSLRLNEFVIDIPPLGERRDDIPVLAQPFLQEANRELQKEYQRILNQRRHASARRALAGQCARAENRGKKDGASCALWHRYNYARRNRHWRDGLVCRAGFCRASV